MPRSSTTSSCTRLGSAEMSTYAVTIAISSLQSSPERRAERPLTGVEQSPSFELHQLDTTRARHLLQLVLNAFDRYREREHPLADLHVGVCRKRMPEHAVQVYGDFWHQVAHVQVHAFLRVAALGQRPNEVVLVRNPERSVKLA